MNITLDVRSGLDKRRRATLIVKEQGESWAELIHNY